jgi:hypothetical protein
MKLPRSSSATFGGELEDVLTLQHNSQPISLPVIEYPSMPPVLVMAPSLAAHQTAPFANELGLIAAGIAPDCSMTAQVSPSVGAALIESVTCIFVAGAQVSFS